MPKLSYNNKKLYYHILGDGMPVIFLHNGFYSSKTWKGILRKFSLNFTVIIYDRIGYGKSTHWEYAIDQDIIENGINELDFLITQLNLKKVHLVGHCLGGAIALLYALRNPEKVEKIVAEAVGYYGDHKSLVKTDWTFRPYDDMDSNLRNTLQKMHGTNYSKLFWKNLCDYDKTYIMSENYDIRQKTKQIKKTIFMINGDRDFYFDVSYPIEVYKKLKNAWLWIVPNCGHDIHIDQKNKFIKNVIEFLKND